MGSCHGTLKNFSDPTQMLATVYFLVQIRFYVK